MNVKILSPAEWSKLSVDAHKIAFAENKPVHMDRIDFALLMVDEEDVPQGYVTCRELDSDTVYWQFGGAFPGTKDTLKSFQVYQKFVGWTSERYARITTRIENENTVMLRMAMKVGFRIVGIRNFNGSILLEHLLEFSGGSK